MSITSLLKYFAIGFVAQVMIFIVAGTFGTGESEVAIYVPWVFLGERILPSGPAGHAMPLGGMLGFLVGLTAYSLLTGFVVHRLWAWRRDGGGSKQRMH